MKKYVFYGMALTGILLFQLVGGGLVKADEKGTAQHLESIKRKDLKLKEKELLLYDFFRSMPKGGDIHTHLTGAVTPELYWELATQAGSGWCVDTVTGKLSKQSGQKLKPHIVQCQGKESDTTFKTAVFKHWSVQGWSGTSQRDSAKHFFDAFGLTGDLADEHTVKLLGALKDSVINDGIQYLEVMAVSPKIDISSVYFKSCYKTDLNKLKTAGNFKSELERLLKKPDYKKFVAGIAQTYVDSIRSYDNQTNRPDLVCRYQGYTNRNNADLLKVFTQLYASFEACAMEKRVGHDSLIVGVNIVSEESDLLAFENYDKHMQMFQVLKEHYQDTVKISLHAGELVQPVLTEQKIQGFMASDGYKNHIQKAIDSAYADRIGHGIDINQQYNAKTFEDDTSKVCTAMLQKEVKRGGKTLRNDTVAIEVNLTSNDFILGVRGAAHCLEYYKTHHVPFVLATDDQGILCTNLTKQYVKLVLEHPEFTYQKIKEIVYNSIRYSFLSGYQKNALKKKLDAKFKGFEDNWEVAKSEGAKSKS